MAGFDFPPSFLENVIAGILTVAVVSSFVGAWHWNSQRTKIRRMRGSNDKDADATLALYADLFPPDGANYTEEELAAFLNDVETAKDSRHVPIENIFLIAKRRGEVIAFIWSCFFPKSRFAIIPYYGIDRTVKQARADIGIRLKLIRRLMRILRSPSNRCRRVVFEVQKATQTTSAEERKRRISRIRRFKDIGRQIELPVRELGFHYKRPRPVIDDPLAKEEELALMVVNIDRAVAPARQADSMSHDEVSTLLEFLYKDCYGSLYPVDDPRHLRFHKYLDKRLKETRRSLPPEIFFK